VEIAGVHQAATAFEGAAPVYEDSRPGYPDEAVDWLIDVLGLGPGRKVVDLAAGTG
jgi:ubiquinone/menaquinone biosynthesis C-methylase UbiE